MRNSTPKWTVTRQCQYATGGLPVVEVSSGGLHYSNPDALSKQYRGEFKEFTDPREAATTAIAICKAWRRDGERQAKVAHGATGGMTLPFEPCTFRELLQWAATTYAALPKCVQCGGLLGEEKWGNWDVQEFDCCSEACADKYYVPLEEDVA